MRLRVAQVVDVPAARGEEARDERVPVGRRIPRAACIAGVPRVLALRDEIVVPQPDDALGGRPPRFVRAEGDAAEPRLPRGRERRRVGDAHVRDAREPDWDAARAAEVDATLDMVLGALQGFAPDTEAAFLLPSQFDPRALVNLQPAQETT